MGVLFPFAKGPLGSDRDRLAGMSSTVTTSSHRAAAPPGEERVIVFSEETDAALDAAETHWLTTEEFARDKELGGWDRSTLQRAVGLNAYGLKQARCSESVLNTHGRRVRVYLYPRWRVLLWLGFHPDGTPPPRRTPRRERPRYSRDTTANRLAEASGMSADQVLGEVLKGRLDAVLDPARERFLFLDPESSRRWLNRHTYRRRR